MSAEALANPLTRAESKSSRKKKTKTTTASENVSSAASTTPTAEQPATPISAEPTVNGQEGEENPYLRELFKNIRNVNKKLNATQKVDSIIAENPDISLDELVATRKINNDQKTQALKKPALQASLAQLEEQVSHYKKFDQEYQTRMATEKALLESTHKKEMGELKDAIRAEAKAEAEKDDKERLLVFSKFLRAAAAKRQFIDEETEESKAFEGVLLLVYGGDASAVASIERLIDGTADQVTATDGTLLNYTFQQVKQASLEYAPFAAEEAWAEGVAQSEPAPLADASIEAPQISASQPIGTDPTTAHAGLTEITAGEGAISANAEIEGSHIPIQTTIDETAANAAADSHWDTKLSASAESGPDGWVQVPRDPAETETGTDATPAANHGQQSWADDHPAQNVPNVVQPSGTGSTNGSDGFHEVHHGRGGRGRGGFQGESRGGRGRGGFRGEGGGYRGRGGYRGDREGGYRGRGRGGRGGRGRDAPAPAPAAAQ
ncbi:hypothetical protein L228DRAFT_269927 [Xylona heveae TC161]|uniref:YAG7-like dimerisation domain-containing protein n=1 Tax=Xylona heveae (strain CBS 132557 / TC161) TaxID=1328760 RepID=A0A165AKC3_XYLHT|nr:hypothetical protein L228DRAFT_269927 [Xylona heveae TC161]KZF20626.1 hypothetical protein L228DRAFT_269927 [Xylona heveae TC161]